MPYKLTFFIKYDNHGKGAPANSMCYGYKYLVELIEPNTNDFCIRW